MEKVKQTRVKTKNFNAVKNCNLRQHLKVTTKAIVKKNYLPHCIIHLLLTMHIGLSDTVMQITEQQKLTLLFHINSNFYFISSLLFVTTIC